MRTLARPSEGPWHAPLGVGVEELAAGAEEDGLGARLAVALRLLAVRLERELADVHLRGGLAVQRQPVEHRCKYNITWGIMGSALNDDQTCGRIEVAGEGGRTWEVVVEKVGEERDFVCVGRHGRR